MQSSNDANEWDQDSLIESVSDQTFHSRVIQSERPVLVEFWAPWCGPCRLLTPILIEISDIKKDQLLVARFNIDDNPILTEALKIQTIPMLAIFYQGKLLNGITGLRPKRDIIDFIDANLK